MKWMDSKNNVDFSQKFIPDICAFPFKLRKNVHKMMVDLSIVDHTFDAESAEVDKCRVAHLV